MNESWGPLSIAHSGSPASGEVMTGPRPGKSVVSRIFAVLHQFGQERAELSLSELAAGSGLAKSTLHRLAGQLTEAGMLEQTERGYRLGLVLFELGQLVPAQRRLREGVLPFMEALYEATHETVHFGFLDGTEVVYVERICGRPSVAAPTRTGGRMPAYCTGLGKAMLAFSPPEVVDTVIRAGLQRRTRHTITSGRTLEDALARVAADGIAYDREERFIGIACAAAPVLGRSGVPLGAISVTTTPVGLPRVVAAVRATAFNLSRELRRMPDTYWRRDAGLVREEVDEEVL